MGIGTARFRLVSYCIASHRIASYRNATCREPVSCLCRGPMVVGGAVLRERGVVISTLDPRLQLSYFKLQDVCR